MSTAPENSKEPDPSKDGDATPPAPEAAAPDQEAPTSGEEMAESAEGGDRRIHPRRKKLLRVQLVNPFSNAEPFSGWVVDRSLGGMCLSVDHEVEPGTHLRARPTNVPPSFPWVELRVQSVRPKDKVWELGCEFERTPTWEVLLQFG